MNRATVLSAALGGSALMILSGTPVLAQMQSFPNGIDCSKLPQVQQTDCRVQQNNNVSTPWVPQGPTAPGGNGTGTEQNGRIMPYGSGQTNGSSSGAGGGNGGASPPGQSGN